MAYAYCVSSIEEDCRGSSARVRMPLEYADTMYIREFDGERDAYIYLSHVDGVTNRRRGTSEDTSP